MHFCKVCWKEFLTKNNKNYFCSIVCRNTYASITWSKKREDTNLKKYWSKQFFTSNKFKSQIDNITKKKKQTCLKKYWVEYSTQSRLIKEKSKQTCLKKYWVEYPSQADLFKEKTKDTCILKYWVENPSQADEIKKKIEESCIKNFWVTTYLLTKDCPKPDVISKKNIKWWERIKHNTWLDIEYEFKWIKWYSYDIKCWKFLFEIDPTVTHNSSIWFRWIKEPIDKLYHQNKSLAAEKEWYYCIHLFDRDDNDNIRWWIKWLLLWRKRLYHWHIKKITSQQAAQFYDMNHLQWKCDATIHYWLFVKDNLINTMSFKNNKWQWTLVRFASLQWYRIAHWAEKLFNTFINEYNPSTVISFSDITKHSWWLYNMLWFKLVWITRPSYWRVWHGNVYRRRNCQKKKMHNIIWFDKNYKYIDHKGDIFWERTEKEIMESKWYVIVYDSWMRKHVRYNKSTCKS